MPAHAFLQVGLWDEAAESDKASWNASVAWAKRRGLPISLSFRRKDILSNARPNYAGDLGLGCNPKLTARA